MIFDLLKCWSTCTGAGEIQHGQAGLLRLQLPGEVGQDWRILVPSSAQGHRQEEAWLDPFFKSHSLIFRSFFINDLHRCLFGLSTAEWFQSFRPTFLFWFVLHGFLVCLPFSLCMHMPSAKGAQSWGRHQRWMVRLYIFVIFQRTTRYHFPLDCGNLGALHSCAPGCLKQQQKTKFIDSTGLSYTMSLHIILFWGTRITLKTISCRWGLKPNP